MRCHGGRNRRGSGGGGAAAAHQVQQHQHQERLPGLQQELLERSCILQRQSYAPCLDERILCLRAI